MRYPKWMSSVESSEHQSVPLQRIKENSLGARVFIPRFSISGFLFHVFHFLPPRSFPMTDATLYDIRRDVAWITLNQPDKRNALSDAVVNGLLSSVRAALDAPAVRMIVITGAGLAFCAGADLKG